MDSDVFFQGGSNLVRVLVVGVLAYAALIGLLRTTGPRALSKLNSFDLVVTVALGSVLATILLSKDVALLEGVVAFTVLLALQYGVTWLSVRSTTISQLVKAEPVLLLYRGEMLHRNMARARVVDAEVKAAVRSQGIASLEEVFAVVLETDGSISVMNEPGMSTPSAIEGILRQRQQDHGPSLN
jgi:uncharacterized membrane protein YcaP (DUF421 family)